jgi:hypothetical protein
MLEEAKAPSAVVPLMMMMMMNPVDLYVYIFHVKLILCTVFDRIVRQLWQALNCSFVVFISLTLTSVFMNSIFNTMFPFGFTAYILRLKDGFPYAHFALIDFLSLK